MAEMSKDGVVFDPDAFDPKRLLDAVAPTLKVKALEHGRQCAWRYGIVLRVTQGLRSMADQAALWAQGRTTPGPVVTASPPGYSWHCFGRAYDVCIVAFEGDKTPRDVYDGPWEEVGTLGEECGLEWGGRWKHPDRPHFEDRGGLTLAAARLRHGMGDTLT